MTHLGARAFEEIGGEVVQTTSFVFRNSRVENYQGVYARLVDYARQDEKEKAFLLKMDLHIAKQENFSQIPGMPIAYWVSEKMVKCYQNKQLGELYSVRQGMTTSDNNRFLRLWYECNIEKCSFTSRSSEEAQNSPKKWFAYNKGGEFRKWYGNKDFLVNSFK